MQCMPSYCECCHDKLPYSGRVCEGCRTLFRAGDEVYVHSPCGLHMGNTEPVSGVFTVLSWLPTHMCGPCVEVFDIATGRKGMIHMRYVLPLAVQRA